MTEISPLDQARILSEALPHMQQYDEETIVIKYGGHAMGAEDTAKAFARDIVLLEQTAINPVVVHGGGPQIATSTNGQTLNINADTFAGAIAGALKAKRLLLLTDVPGVLDKSKKLIPELSIKDARKLIADGTISGGMIPKVETCIYALEQGVQGVVIIDGKMQHAVLLELFTNQGTGTLIHK
jgi:acetylglutamate kinase